MQDNPKKENKAGEIFLSIILTFMKLTVTAKMHNLYRNKKKWVMENSFKTYTQNLVYDSVELEISGKT